MHCVTCAGRSAPNNAERISTDMTFIMPAIETGTPSSQARRSFIECLVLDRKWMVTTEPKSTPAVAERSYVARPADRAGGSRRLRVGTGLTIPGRVTRGLFDISVGDRA